MSDQTTFHDVEYLCTNDNLEASIKECLDKYKAYGSTYNLQALEDIPLGGCAYAMEVKEKEDKGTRFLDFLRDLLVILFPSRAERLGIGETGHDSFPVLLHKSNGCYMQSMIWNPGGMYKNQHD